MLTEKVKFTPKGRPSFVRSASVNTVGSVSEDAGYAPGEISVTLRRDPETRSLKGNNTFRWQGTEFVIRSIVERKHDRLIDIRGFSGELSS